jgi:hypothetical protein
MKTYKGFPKPKKIGLLNVFEKEINKRGYKRVKINIDEFDDDGGNLFPISFNESKEDWGLISGVVLFDERGHILSKTISTIPKNIKYNTTISFDVGQLTFSHEASTVTHILKM